MDLIVGATGRVGGSVAGALRARGRAVRGIVRGDTNRPALAALREAGVEIVAADLGRPGTLDDALRGADTVVCTATAIHDTADGALDRVDRDGVLALIERARAAGCGRFVYLSFAAGMDRPSAFHDAKRACERAALASGMEAVVLRPNFFMEVWLGAATIDLAAGTAVVFGAGDAPIRYVSATDVARFAVAAVERPEIRGVLELGGPEALSQREGMSAIERALGRPLALRQVPLEALEAQYRSDDPRQRSLAALMLTAAGGVDSPGAVATAAELGIALRGVEAYAATIS
jgi:uncharacterized protein YbjT (DUF2867 family)